ncbi:hypothetical protein GCM10009827_015850 [Dactylosporangium maewongense]|uniref:DUF488 domain-containing protein n=1 Tax=Dactylosporangium maewongense TaxID=634393 RepID=A0ABN1ZSV5_9ACTN
MTATLEAPGSGLIGLGYEGRTVDDLVAELLALKISRLVDIRMTPLSRKPGLSKSALRAALADAGIEYEHRRELGNPKDNRPGFAGSPATLQAARARYAELLRRPEAVAALTAVADAGRRERVAVLCFEADQSRCHRDLVLNEALQRMSHPRGGQ